MHVLGSYACFRLLCMFQVPMHVSGSYAQMNKDISANEYIALYIIFHEEKGGRSFFRILRNKLKIAQNRLTKTMILSYQYF